LWGIRVVVGRGWVGKGNYRRGGHKLTKAAKGELRVCGGQQEARGERREA
jgi:hypothetical protein